MTGLLDGATVPWHIVSGRHEPGIQPDPYVLERVQARRRAATQLPPPVRREPITPIQINPQIVEAAGRFNKAVGVAMVRLAENLRRYR